MDELAGMVNRGFNEAHKRFGGLDKRMDGLDQRLGSLTQKMDAGFAHVNARLDRIVDEISDLPAIREELHALDRRVSRLERKTGVAQG